MCPFCGKACKQKCNAVRHLQEKHGFINADDNFPGFESHGRPGRAVKKDAWAAFQRCSTEDDWIQSIRAAVLRGTNPATAAVYAAQSQGWREAVAHRITQDPGHWMRS